MKTSPLVLAALLSKVNAVEYPLTDGPCPFGAGELASNVKLTLNPHRLTGRWMNVFDRSSLDEEHKCYGAKLMHTHEYDDANLSIHKEEDMEGVQKVFEYIKVTNVGRSPDMGVIRDENDPEPEEPTQPDTTEYESAHDEEEDMLSFGYNIYHGF